MQTPFKWAVQTKSKAAETRTYHFQRDISLIKERLAPRPRHMQSCTRVECCYWSDAWSPLTCEWFLNEGFLSALLKISPHQSSFCFALGLGGVWTWGWKPCLPKAPIKMLLPSITVVCASVLEIVYLCAGWEWPFSLLVVCFSRLWHFIARVNN